MEGNGPSPSRLLPASLPSHRAMRGTGNGEKGEGGGKGKGWVKGEIKTYLKLHLCDILEPLVERRGLVFRVERCESNIRQ